MSEFADFINEYSAKSYGDEPMFVPGQYDETAAAVWTPWDEVFPIEPEEIMKAEEDLNCRLPVGYCTFMGTLGPGLWAGAGIPLPESLSALDQDFGEMCGFIPLAFNVNGRGDYIAFHPRDPRKIYFCSNDPFGYAEAETSFESLIKKITLCAIDDPGSGVANYLESLQPFHEVMPPEIKTSKQWWQFWK